MTTDNWTINRWLAQATERLGGDSPSLDAELLLADRLGKSRSYLLAFSEQLLPPQLLTQLAADMEQLAGGYPLAYLLGKKAFWDMELRVTPATLIPRPDTETLIELAQTLLPADTTAKMIDLGTGSGAIAIALSRIFPKANITATDLSAEALAVAQQNAREWQIAPIKFQQTSWLTGFERPQFDLIVSNPPYIAEDDWHLQHLTAEPQTALCAPDAGLADLKTLIAQATRCLKPAGWLLLEHGYDQGQAVRALFEQAGCWQQIQTHRDLGGNERVTGARLKLATPQSARHPSTQS